MVSCTKGTYVRSLVHDIGKKIGCGAAMTELRRLETGKFSIEDSIPLYDFLKFDYNKMLDSITPIEEYFMDSKKVNLSREEYNQFINGVKFDVETQDKIVRVYSESRFRGLGVVEENIMKRLVID